MCDKFIYLSALKGLRKIIISEFTKCLIFLTGIGVLSLFLGKEIPRHWVKPYKFPFNCFKWENDGRIYEKIHIKRWKDRLPDMSRYLKSMITKEIPSIRISWQQLETLIYESCIAEADHWVLMIAGFGCTYIWEGVGGFVVSVLWALGNLPFAVIQRYNRPNMKRIVLKLKAREMKRGQA